ncbi:MAG: hypothetical protein U5K31_01415 [Balneolaceae bacterium]|nr:hypothetical protein [Balneolaceae bacterium]
MKHASNRQLTLLRKLNRKKYREQEGLFFVEGERAVDQVIENGVLAVRELFFDEDLKLWERDPWNRHSGKVSSSMIDSGTFLDVADTESPQGILALCEIPAEASADELAAGAGPVLAIDALQDPGNLGTIVRSGSGSVPAGIICWKGTVDLYHPKVVRGTAGSTGCLPWMNGELEEVFPQLKPANGKYGCFQAQARVCLSSRCSPPATTFLLSETRLMALGRVF